MSNEQTEESLQLEINKEIEKLKYYVENVDETINEGDFNEIKIINNRATAILDKINTLVASIQELKIDRGETARNVRQWKKENKEIYRPLVEKMGNYLTLITRNKGKQTMKSSGKNKKQNGRTKNVVGEKYESAKEKCGKKNLTQNYE